MEGRAKYFRERGEKGSQKVIARARCGNIEKCNRYLLDKGNIFYKLCRRGKARLEHGMGGCESV